MPITSPPAEVDVPRSIDELLAQASELFEAALARGEDRGNPVLRAAFALLREIDRRDKSGITQAVRAAWCERIG